MQGAKAMFESLQVLFQVTQFTGKMRGTSEEILNFSSSRTLIPRSRYTRE